MIDIIESGSSTAGLPTEALQELACVLQRQIRGLHLQLENVLIELDRKHAAERTSGRDAHGRTGVTP